MTPSQFRIRRATREDIDSLAQFGIDMARETEGKALAQDLVARGVSAVFDDPARGFYLVAECDGRAVGGLLVTPEWSDWWNASYWWIQSVYVQPEYRSRGIYTGLHRRVEELAIENGGVCAIRLYVDRANTAAQAVYTRLGMNPARYDFFEKVLRSPDSG
jgi:GNAT superfamily N-acetyltransferase